jgi:hypothetical protein
MLIQTKARFNLAGALHILRLIGDMYIMVPVTAKLIPLSTDRSETEKIVDLVSGNDGKKMRPRVIYRFQKSSIHLYRLFR